jgi:hypothetical protein
MAVTAAVVTENVRMSRCWKAELVTYGIRIQTLPRFMYFLPLKPHHLEWVISVTSRKIGSLTANLVFEVSGEIIAKFRQNPDLDRMVESAQNSDLLNRLGFRHPKLANR